MSAEGMNTSGQFSTTRWSVVLLAGQEASTESALALEKLCRAYWSPIYFFARRKGWEDADAKDLTQQFFLLLLARKDFSGLDPRKGKFRTFLLTAFMHFLANEHDRAGALKRGGDKKILSLDAFATEEMSDCAVSAAVSPGDLFDQRWAKTILRTALAKLAGDMAQAGKAPLFEALKPFLAVNANAKDYEAVAARLGVEGSSIPVMVHRLRQRFREQVRAEVAETVTTPTELEEEMRHLFAVLNQ